MLPQSCSQVQLMDTIYTFHHWCAVTRTLILKVKWGRAHTKTRTNGQSGAFSEEGSDPTLGVVVNHCNSVLDNTVGWCMTEISSMTSDKSVMGLVCKPCDQHSVLLYRTSPINQGLLFFCLPGTYLISPSLKLLHQQVSLSRFYSHFEPQWWN